MKTCRHGHELAGDNLAIVAGRQRCRRCIRETAIRREDEKAERRAAVARRASAKSEHPDWTWRAYFEQLSREEVMPHHLRGLAERMRQWLVSIGATDTEPGEESEFLG